MLSNFLIFPPCNLKSSTAVYNYSTFDYCQILSNCWQILKRNKRVNLAENGKIDLVCSLSFFFLRKKLYWFSWIGTPDLITMRSIDLIFVNEFGLFWVNTVAGSCCPNFLICRLVTWKATVLFITIQHLIIVKFWAIAETLKRNKRVNLGENGKIYIICSSSFFFLGKNLYTNVG